MVARQCEMIANVLRLHEHMDRAGCAAPLARRDSWLRRLASEDDDAESPCTRMAEGLTQIGLDRQTVGFEQTYLSAARWEEIRRRLPEVRMVDCTDMMAQVRWITTAGESARFKVAADLLDAASLEVCPTVVAGETERDVHSRLVASAIHAFAAEPLRQQGDGDRVSLVGHGVGPWWHQQEPDLVSTCQPPVEDGMVLALEPHVGSWHLQDLMVMTRHGPQRLSDRFNTDAMFVID